MKKAVLIILTATVLLTLCCSCSAQKRYEATFYDYFDTVITITAYCQDKAGFETLKSVAEGEFKRFHDLFDIYGKAGFNNIKTINDNAGAAVQVDKDIIELLSFAKEICIKTGGKINVGMGSVTALWHDFRENKTDLPTSEQLGAAAEHTDINRLVIDAEKSTVCLEDKEMRLDVGAVAKGYAVQKVAEELKRRGYESFLISAGGNVLANGKKGDGTDWKVGIENPLSSNFADVMSGRNLSFVTSGSYQRYRVVDGVRYHHIIDPETLMPENRYVSVTVTAQDSALADAISTALFNASIEEGNRIAQEFGVRVLWILPNGEIKNTVN